MLAGVTDVGGVGNGATEEDWRWDLNPGVAATPKGGPHGFGREEGEENHMALAEWGPRGVGGENHEALAEWGPHGHDTADGARSLNHGLLLLFLRYGTQDWAEGEGRAVCICGYSKGL